MKCENKEGACWKSSSIHVVTIKIQIRTHNALVAKSVTVKGPSYNQNSIFVWLFISPISKSLHLHSLILQSQWHQCRVRPKANRRSSSGFRSTLKCSRRRLRERRSRDIRRVNRHPPQRSLCRAHLQREVLLDQGIRRLTSLYVWCMLSIWI